MFMFMSASRLLIKLITTEGNNPLRAVSEKSALGVSQLTRGFRFLCFST